MQPLTQDTGMSLASVVLASALQVRGEALLEEEIWSLLSLAVERLLEDLREDSLDYVICPWSALLSAAGSLSFQDHVSHIEAAPFKAPELLQGQSGDEQPDASQMHVYALGMTLYWSAGFHVPQNQVLGRHCQPTTEVLLLSSESTSECCSVWQCSQPQSRIGKQKKTYLLRGSSKLEEERRYRCIK